MAQVSQDAALHGILDVPMDLETPMKTISEEQLTPRRSERKRALFPTASPQTSDLGHMSPLGSSPERYSSAPASPDSTSFSPIRKSSGPISPFGRKPSTSRALYKDSPRKQFALLLADVVNQPKNKTGIVKIKNSTGIVRISPSKQNEVKPVEYPREIVPADQLEQTVLSVMDESDCAESPRSQRTPSTTPRSSELVRAISDLGASQPLTPSKRRSMPASGSGSVTSASPSSPEKKRRHIIEGRSRSAGAELPRARTSLFPGISRSVGAKRSRDDGIYLTGRSTKRRKVNGEINAGVRTGIRRPPKIKPKVNQPPKKQGKVKSIWDVAPKPSRKKNISPIKLAKMSMLAKPVKKSDEEIASLSASASLQVRSKRSKPEEDTASESEQEAIESPPPDPTKRIFKTGIIKSRTATVTISKNIRIKIHKGKFTVDKSSPAPPPKRRRKLYSHDKQIESIKAFDDNEEDVAASTRNDVQNILQKLEEDKCNSPESIVPVNPSMNSAEETSHADGSYIDAMPTSPVISSTNVVPSSPVKSSSNVVLSSPVKSSAHVVPSSPVRSSEMPPEDNVLSPLSQLASSTSTLSINVGGDTLHLTESQVQTLSAVPDVIMEDDDLPLCEPLPEDDGNSDTNETKENENSSELDSTPVKYFPIFDSNFSHQKTQQSPSVMQKRRRSLLRPIGNDQYQLDAGQKRFGATECSTCSAIYQMGEPEDELAHQEFHNAVKDLKFMGWKNERVVGLDGRNRVVLVRPGDPKAWWSKALDVLRVVDKDLGFAEGVQCDPNHSMVYLYISERSVVGCLLAVPVKKANKMLETTLEAEGIDCCTAEEYPVKCGVSRIWVHRPNRRANVARQLMDCMRKNFIFGHVLTLEEIAFSSPTVLGKVFAEHYTGRRDYFVYTNA